ncbi:MAG: amylo-alpha-1,6-glucosidase [Gemmatimonadaceae bacterium]
MRMIARLVVLLALAAPLAAQQPAPATGTVPYFPVGESPLALRGDARAGQFVSAVGRRAIAMGTEDGRLELWTWPYKWLHDFQLAFRIPKYAEAIPGPQVARSVVVRPEGVTIEYAHEQFTVRQHVFVPLDEPAVVMLLEVDALRPLDVVAGWTPDVHLAWPAGLGGQYMVWNDAARAFLFSESRRQVNAFLGSPAVTQASDVPAHMLGGAPPQLVLGVGGAGERYTAPRLGEPPGRSLDLRARYIPIILAGGEMPREQALALYRRLSEPGAAEREWRRRVAHADSLRRTTLSLRSPDTLLNRAAEWAKVNLDESLVCNADLGCGMVAGYGLSGGASDRPGFGWFFGGDASINSLAAASVGSAALVRDGALRFFARYQRADGKITHEISQAAGKIDWFGAYPYAFYHGDTTPFWILAFGEYWRQAADTALVRELWPHLKKAYEWSRAQDADGDGLMENPLAGAGALEVGDLQAGILSDVYLSGVWAASLERFARMAEAMGEARLAADARGIRAKAVRTLEQRLWLPSLKQYAFALLEGGKVNESLTAWPATAMAFDVLDPTRGADMAARLASAEITTDWGARPLSARSPLFDPLHYNNGAVWPFVTGWVSLAQYRYHNAHAGRQALDAVARTTFGEARGRNPEVISGRLYKPLDTAVPQQFFASSMVLTPLVRGLLGIDVDAPAGRITIAPHLPPDWDSVRVENVPVGQERVTVALRQEARRIQAHVERAQPALGRTPLEVIFSPALPLGAVPTGRPAETTPGDIHATVRGPLRDSATFTVELTGGWSIVPPAAHPAIGDRSESTRVLSERLVEGRYVVAMEGLAGRTYRFALVAPGRAIELAASGGARAVLSEERELHVTFPATATTTDGYAATTVTVRVRP